MHAENCGVVLNLDIWYAISREVFGRGHRQDLAALCLVSRRVNATATPWLYRSIRLNSTTAKNHLSCFVNNENAHLHLIREFAMQGLDPSTESAQLGKLVNVLPHLSNIDRFHWKSAKPFRDALMRALQAHPSIKEIVVETCLSIDNIGPAYNFGLDRTSPAGKTGLHTDLHSLATIKRVVNTLTDVDRSCFSGYCFPPGFGALQHMDITRMRVLELDCCANIGYLFNSLLCEIANVQLETLTISRTQAQSKIGYTGKEKIECFLTVHKGLEEMIFANLGDDRPCLPAILAQGKSLRILKLLESYVKDSDANEGRQNILSGKDKARICKACPHLRQLVLN